MRRTALLLAGLVLASCATDTQSPTTTGATTGTSAITTTTTQAAATPSTTSPATTTEPIATTSTSTTTSTTTSTAPPTSCPAAPPLAAGTVAYAGGIGDFDGDGQSDQIATYQAGPDSWRLRVTFADGGGADAAITDAEDFAPPRPIGGFDIDGEGTDEVFISVGAGASTVQLGLFAVAGCVVSRVTEGGAAAVFAVGASIGNVSGVVCPGDGTIHRVFAQYVAEDVYEGGFAPYALEGAVLTAFPGDGAGFTADEAFALAILDCGSLSLP